MTDRSVTFPASGRKDQRALTFDAPALAGYEWPYVTISGRSDGPALCVIAGIHGAEYPPIDAVMRFCQAIDPASLRGRIVALPVVNLPAFWERTAFVCPRDGKNPNRAFPGDLDGTFTEVLAYHVFTSVIRRGDYLVDVHGGDLVEELEPFSLVYQSGRDDQGGLDHATLDLAMAYGLPYLIALPRGSGPVSGMTNAAAMDAGIPAVIAEAGGMGQLQERAVELHLRGLRRVLLRLGMLDGTLEPLPEPTLIREFVWVRAERGGFFRKAIVAGQALRAGDTLGRMVTLWGEPREEITSPVDGTALFVTTSPAIADDGLVAGIGVPAWDS